MVARPFVLLAAAPAPRHAECVLIKDAKTHTFFLSDVFIPESCGFYKVHSQLFKRKLWCRYKRK